MISAFRKEYPNVATLIDDGCAVDINSDGGNFYIAGIFEGSRMICQFDSSGMKAEEILSTLEELATRYLEDDMVTDDLNGTEWSCS